MTPRLAHAIVILASALALASCAGSGSDAAPEPRSGVRLTMSGGCGDAFLWAATPKGDLAVTVSVEARDRSTTEPTTMDLELPDPDVTVEVLRGKDLARNFCNDVILPESEPTDTQGATAGTGSLTLDAATGDAPTACGSTSGRLRLRGLVADDGTTFAPIEASSDQIGCYAG